ANDDGGPDGPFSIPPSAVRFGIANLWRAPLGRKWKPDSHSITRGTPANNGMGPDSMIERRYGQIGTETAAGAPGGAVQQPGPRRSPCARPSRDLPPGSAR